MRYNTYEKTHFSLAISTREVLPRRYSGTLDICSLQDFQDLLLPIQHFLFCIEVNAPYSLFQIKQFKRIYRVWWICCNTNICDGCKINTTTWFWAFFFTIVVDSTIGAKEEQPSLPTFYQFAFLEHVADSNDISLRNFVSVAGADGWGRKTLSATSPGSPGGVWMDHPTHNAIKIPMLGAQLL